MPHYLASDLDLHCLLRPVCPNTSGYYGTLKVNIEFHNITRHHCNMTESIASTVCKTAPFSKVLSVRIFLLNTVYIKTLDQCA